MKLRKDTITRIVSFILVAYAAQLFDLTPKISPWAADVSGATFAEFHRATDFYMSKRMPVFVQSFMLFNLIFLGLTWRNRSSWSFGLVALGLVLQLVGTIIAIKTNVAMNAAMNAWDPTHLPTNWATVRAEWLSAHSRNFFFNVPISVLVFMGCYLYWIKPLRTT
jgi:glycerol uptake facilitator-like aquaporin